MAKIVKNTDDKQPRSTQQANTPGQTSKTNVLLENPEILIDNAEESFKKNQNIFIGIGIGIIVLVGAIFAYNAYQAEQEMEAQEALYPSVYDFEADSTAKALSGAGYMGMVDIADEYSGTKAGNLAKFYAGVAALKEGNHDEAISYLEDFSSSDFLVQARAYSLVGDAYMEKQSYSEAISYYQKAADYKPNKQFTPTYLLKLGLAQEMAGNKDMAASTYSMIVNQYPQSVEANEARKYKGMSAAK